MANRKDVIVALKARSRFWIGDELHVQPDRLIVLRGAEEIKLEPRMMQVLVMLAEHSGEVVRKEDMLVEVWGNEVYGDNPVSKTVSGLRDLIGDTARNSRYIETVNKVGYRLKAPVTLGEDYRRMAVDRWTDGSPYVGLSAFDAAHTPVFCGRVRAVADLLRAMRSQIDNQRRFVLIVGASGCGKTSLLRAGALPLLTKPDGFDGLRAVSVAECDLATTPSGDPFTPLVEALSRWEVAGRPVFPTQTTEQLKKMLTESAERAGHFVAEAFRNPAAREFNEQPYTHLLLTIDHAETLVATGAEGNANLTAFSCALKSLCECPHVFVTMITRGDFYLKLLETLPELAEYKSGDGHLDVMPPRPGEIAEIIRYPAWKADLTFETDPETRSRLDDVLRDAAVSQPDVLPLLQHTLDILYERGKAHRKLTFAAYNEIGGLEGAIAHRAEQVFNSLPKYAQASLDTLFSRIIVIQPDSDAASARRAHEDEFKDGAQVLVEAFILARLFVGDHNNGRATVGVTHEALLRRWPRAAEWTQENRRRLMAKARIDAATARWDREGRGKDHLLNPGRPLAEAIEVADSGVFAPDSVEMEYIAQSRKHAMRMSRLRNLAMSALAALSLASITLTIISIRSLEAAETQRERATDLTGFIVGELFDRIDPTGDLELIESVGMKVMEYCRQSSVDMMRTADIIACSKAARKIGAVRLEQSKFQEAETLIRYAVDLSAQGEASEPDNPAAVTEAGQACSSLGKLRLKQLKHREAVNAWRTYLAYTDRLLAMNSKNPVYMMEKSYALTNLGYAFKAMGDLHSAKDYLVESARYKSKALSIKSNNQWKLDDIVTRSMIADVDASAGRIQDAIRQYSALIDRLSQMLQASPSASEWNRQMASLLQLQTMLALDLGDIALAQQRIDDAAQRLLSLTTKERENVNWRILYAHALYISADVSRHRGNIRDSRSKLAQASEALQLVDRESPFSKSLKALVTFRIAMLRNDPTADGLAAQSLSELRALASSEDYYYRFAAADALLLWAAILRERNDADNAAWHANEAARVMTGLKAGKDDIRTMGIIARVAMLGESAAASSTRAFQRIRSAAYRHPDYLHSLTIFCGANDNYSKGLHAECLTSSAE